jgi:hypothetical protein
LQRVALRDQLLALSQQIVHLGLRLAGQLAQRFRLTRRLVGFGTREVLLEGFERAGRRIRTHRREVGVQTTHRELAVLLKRERAALRTAALDEGATAALANANIDTTVKGRLEVVDPASVADLTSGALADQLGTSANITENDVSTALQGLSSSDQALLRELLAHQAEIFSPRRQAIELQKQAAMLVDVAKQKGVPENQLAQTQRIEPNPGDPCTPDAARELQVHIDVVGHASYFIDK